MKVSCGTTKEQKLSALKKAFDYLSEKGILFDTIEIEGYETESGVPATPYNEQTYLGAKNRSEALYKYSSDLYIGIESGLVEREGTLFEECWCVVKDKNKNEYIGISSAMKLPDVFIKKMKEGKTHVQVCDEECELLNVSTKDTWAIYTKNNLNRADCMYEACRNALLNCFSQIGKELTEY